MQDSIPRTVVAGTRLTIPPSGVTAGDSASYGLCYCGDGPSVRITSDQEGPLRRSQCHAARLDSLEPSRYGSQVHQ
jgi:hypothetical protein